MMVEVRELELTAVKKLSRDLKASVITLTDDSARFLVDTYYTMQDNRIRSRGQERSLGKAEEPHEVLTFFGNQFEELEGQIKNALDAYTKAHPMGVWLRDIHGIGPVIAAGLLAFIDMDKSPTAGHIWAFAGWAADGQKPWEKGKIKPFSSQFRTICWHAGQSFMKFAANEKCIYGHIYQQRKAYEMAKNERKEYADQAAIGLTKVARSTDAYKHYSEGKLPPGRIDARARRYAVKIFLSHLHQVWYQLHFGTPAPAPFAISHLGHAHMIDPPVGKPVVAKTYREGVVKKAPDHNFTADSKVTLDTGKVKAKPGPKKKVVAPAATPVKKTPKKPEVKAKRAYVRKAATAKPLPGIKKSPKKPEVKAKRAYVRKAPVTKKPAKKKTNK